jgi:hypothetical protein
MKSPFFVWPVEYFHRAPWKHLPNTLFQQRKEEGLAGWVTILGEGGEIHQTFAAHRQYVGEADKVVLLFEVRVHQEFDFWVANVFLWLGWLCGRCQGRRWGWRGSLGRGLALWRTTVRHSERWLGRHSFAGEHRPLDWDGIPHQISDDCKV